MIAEMPFPRVHVCVGRRSTPLFPCRVAQLNNVLKHVYNPSLNVTSPIPTPVAEVIVLAFSRAASASAVRAFITPHRSVVMPNNVPTPVLASTVTFADRTIPLDVAMERSVRDEIVSSV